MPQVASAQDDAAIVARAVEDHILPRYQALAVATRDLAAATADACGSETPEVTRAFHRAFDAWIGISHITFGPVEADGRFYALSFWPDTRGMTGRSLAGLIAGEDGVVDDAQDYATVSIAARGFYALEYLLFDPEISTLGEGAYRCRLAAAITADIAATVTDIQDNWNRTFADLMLTAGSNDRFQSTDEAMRALFGALTAGLEFTADLRIGRPLGSFDAPRPNRAEARRSGRSLAHVILSLEALADLAALLVEGDEALQRDLSDAFGAALARAADLDDPVFAGVSDPQERLRIEVLQQRIRDVRTLVISELGPSLGVAAGFNSLDGD
jgi:hypothetical protein